MNTERMGEENARGVFSMIKGKRINGSWFIHYRGQLYIARTITAAIKAAEGRL